MADQGDPLDQQVHPLYPSRRHPRSRGRRQGAATGPARQRLRRLPPRPQATGKSQVNIWCWPIGSGEVYGYRTDPKMSAVRPGRSHPQAPGRQAGRPVEHVRDHPQGRSADGRPQRDHGHRECGTARNPPERADRLPASRRLSRRQVRRQSQPGPVPQRRDQAAGLIERERGCPGDVQGGRPIRLDRASPLPNPMADRIIWISSDRLNDRPFLRSVYPPPCVASPDS